MKRTLMYGSAVLALALLLAPSPAPAQEDGTVARVAYWTIRDGHEADFEAGLAAHNQIHAAQKDPHPLLTWEIVSGKRAGQYLRGSFGHKWADFDQAAANAEADAADSAKNLDPHIASAEPVFGVWLPMLSNPPSGPPSGVSQVIYFHVNQGMAQQFEGAIKKVHAALAKVEGGWPSYLWYRLSSGSLPTYVLSLPRSNWAGFAPGDPSLFDAVAAEYGPEDARATFAEFSAAVEHQHAYFSVFRSDLSYMPASE